ncbi:MAG: ABC transporter substrate-binding protein [Clostridia bacterium]|nr:ABC transporter substrate-binding protein [Clostridia bacterium]
MKKTLVALVLLVIFALGCLTACTPTVTIDPNKAEYTVGICQLIQHPALDAATEGFKDGLKKALEAEGRTVVFKEENANGEPDTCAQITSTFVAQGVDLILANATASLTSAVSATRNIPILGTSITDYASALNIKDWTGVAGGNVSGTSDLAPLDKQAEMIVELFPNAKKVGLLYCSAESNSLYQVTEIANVLKQNGIETRDFSFIDTSDLEAVTTQACAWSDVIYVPTDNIVANNATFIDSICSANKKPVVAGEEGICKGCGVATLSIDYFRLGQITGQMAADVLLGKKDISTLAIATDTNPTYKYVASRCEEFGITIPEGYVVIEE